MIHKLYAIFDSKAETYSAIMAERLDAEMLRGFSDVSNDKTHSIGKHPEDYTLFAIGQYDDNTGAITQDQITSIANGLQLQENK